MEIQTWNQHNYFMSLLNALPAELIQEVLSSLDITSVLSLGYTCKFWYAILWFEEQGYMLKNVAQNTNRFLKLGQSDYYRSIKYGGSMWFHCITRYQKTLKSIKNAEIEYAMNEADVNHAPIYFDSAVSLVMDGDPRIAPFIPTFDVGKKSFRGRAEGENSYRLNMINSTFEVFGPNELLPIKTNYQPKQGQNFFTIFETDDIHSDTRLVVVKLRHDRYKALLLDGSHVVRKMRLGFETRLRNPIFAFSDGLLFMCDDGRMFAFDMMMNKQVAYRDVNYKGSISSMAVTQTHMWLVNAYATEYDSVYAIELSKLIDPRIFNEHIPLSDWTKVLTFGNNNPNFFNNPTWKFGAFKFYGEYVGLVSGNQTLLIDLLNQKAVYHSAGIEFSDDGRWVVDRSGNPVYFEMSFINQLIGKYKRDGFIGRVAMPELRNCMSTQAHI